tara:strand:+ start:17327 stop:17608 length:282 start_codon:yes stop_codon:yes gene_type:complete
MTYEIKPRQRANAKKLGLTIKPSTNKKKKLDVFKGDKKIASIGGAGYGDYATFIKEKGLEFANERRRLYKIRHEKTRKKVGSNSYYADKILWN